MLSAIGHIIVTDFGSAKELSDGEKTSTLAGDLIILYIIICNYHVHIRYTSIFSSRSPAR
jgi:hypothetical protein